MFNGIIDENIFDRGGRKAMITCNCCGRVSGYGAKGDSWICEDCRVKPIPERPKEPKQSESSARCLTTGDHHPGS